MPLTLMLSTQFCHQLMLKVIIVLSVLCISEVYVNPSWLMKGVMKVENHVRHILASCNIANECTNAFRHCPFADGCKVPCHMSVSTCSYSVSWFSITGLKKHIDCQSLQTSATQASQNVYGLLNALEAASYLYKLNG